MTDHFFEKTLLGAYQQHLDVSVEVTECDGDKVESRDNRPFRVDFGSFAGIVMINNAT